MAEKPAAADVVAASPAAGDGNAFRFRFLPRHQIGWWVLAILVVTALYPLWWPALEDLIPNDAALAAAAVVIAVSALVLGGVTIFRKDRSVLLILIYGVTLSMVLSGVAVLALRFGGLESQIPEFPSLAQNPDRSLSGTVAYYSDRSGCVRIVAAAGQPTQDVLCLPPLDPSDAAAKGKPIGPQLVWLPDGRLEVTMFRMTDPPGPGFNPGWQKIVDVRTKNVEDVPPVNVSSVPNRDNHPAVNASGARISWTSNEGRVEVVLNDATGSRTLLSVSGPRDSYRMGSAFWAPNGQWIAADDGRILTITTGDPSVTRILTDESSAVEFDTELSRFAVTDANILTT